MISFYPCQQKAKFVTRHLVDATVVVVPSPDSSKFSITVAIPPQTPSQLLAATSPPLQFKLLCGLDAAYRHTTISCKVCLHLSIKVLLKITILKASIQVWYKSLVSKILFCVFSSFHRISRSPTKETYTESREREIESVRG